MPRSTVTLLFCMLLALSAARCLAQQAPALAPELLSTATLPDSPGSLHGGSSSAGTEPAAAGSEPVVAPATISGVVEDVNGGVVPGAVIVLLDAADKQLEEATADSMGAFTITAIQPARVRVKIYAPGLETFVSKDIHLAPGERYNLHPIALPLMPVNSEVSVEVTQDQIAVEQVNLQVKQRVLGVIPNFYSSYIWNAAPMPAKQKYRLAFRAALDPFTFITAAGVAGVEQAHNTFPGYGDDAASYGYRYGAVIGDQLTSKLIGSALLPAVFHQDPRYFYRGTGSVWSRASYAVRSAFVARGDNGKWQPAYAHILGNFAASAVGNLYRTPEDRRLNLTLRNGAIITASNAFSNLLREFLLKRLTSNIPDTSNGLAPEAPEAGGKPAPPAKPAN